MCTLRAVLTLHEWRQAVDQERIARGVEYLQTHTTSLAADPWELVAFELIFPTLLVTAWQHGLDVPYGAFSEVERLRAAKLDLASFDLAYDRRMPLAVSLEGLGAAVDVTQTEMTQEEIGTVAMSPASTAFLLLHDPGNTRAVEYLTWALHAVGDGGAPAYFPLETFERSWGLYQLQHVWPTLHQDLPTAVTPALEFLSAHRLPAGWTSSIHATPKEADTTAVVFSVLSRAGYALDPALLYQYEEADHFRCYPFERNPSISVHAHLLDALHYCDPASRGSRIAKVVRFLKKVQQPEGHWLDKWHVSPYYTTSRVVLVAAAHNLARDLAAPAVHWLLSKQREDGGWGFYPPVLDSPTVEETAYALLALLSWHAAGHRVSRAVLERGATYLRAHANPFPASYPPLWIAKSLFVPVQVVQAAVLAAMLGCEQIGV
jgi:halimadienyl-diphosphate synthase